MGAWKISSPAFCSKQGQQWVHTRLVRAWKPVHVLLAPVPLLWCPHRDFPPHLGPVTTLPAPIHAHGCCSPTTHLCNKLLPSTICDVLHTAHDAVAHLCSPAGPCPACWAPRPFGQSFSWSSSAQPVLLRAGALLLSLLDFMRFMLACFPGLSLSPWMATLFSGTPAAPLGLLSSK